MDKDKKGMVFPIIMIILLCLIGFVLLVVMIGENVLSKDGIRLYFRETDNMFSEKQKLQLEKYFKDKNVTSSVVEYINTNEELKLMIQSLIFDICDGFRDDNNFEIDENKLVDKIRIEVYKFEEKESVQVWDFIEKDVRKLVNDINSVYNSDYVPVMKTIFNIFSRRTVIIIMVIFGLLVLPLLIFRRVWGILYAFIAVVMTSGLAYYIVNYIEFSGDNLQSGVINCLKEIANYNIYKFVFVAVLLFMLFIMCLVIKPMMHRINIRFKALRM